VKGPPSPEPSARSDEALLAPTSQLLCPSSSFLHAIGYSQELLSTLLHTQLHLETFSRSQLKSTILLSSFPLKGQLLQSYLLMAFI
jgi:hypothetical protein